MGGRTTSKNTLLRRLGSKVVNNRPDDPNKAPWVRGYIADVLPWGEVDVQVKTVLAAWLEGAMPAQDVQALIASDVPTAR